MQETTQQYVARISGYVAGKNHLKVLQSTPRRIGLLMKRAPRTRLVKRSQADKWSAGEILAHLAESELVLGFRLRLVLGANGTSIQAFDQDRWQENAGYLKKDPTRAFELFRVLRDNNVAPLRSLSKEQWSSHGVHQERGQETVARMVELYAGHDVNHTTQIEEIVKGTRKTET